MDTTAIVTAIGANNAGVLAVMGAVLALGALFVGFRYVKRAIGG